MKQDTTDVMTPDNFTQLVYLLRNLSIYLEEKYPGRVAKGRFMEWIRDCSNAVVIAACARVYFAAFPENEHATLLYFAFTTSAQAAAHTERFRRSLDDFDHADATLALTRK